MIHSFFLLYLTNHYISICLLTNNFLIGVLGVVGLLDDLLIALICFLHVAALYRSVLYFRHAGSWTNKCFWHYVLTFCLCLCLWSLNLYKHDSVLFWLWKLKWVIGPYRTKRLGPQINNHSRLYAHLRSWNLRINLFDHSTHDSVSLTVWRRKCEIDGIIG